MEPIDLVLAVKYVLEDNFDVALEPFGNIQESLLYFFFETEGRQGQNGQDDHASLVTGLAFIEIDEFAGITLVVSWRVKCIYLYILKWRTENQEMSAIHLYHRGSPSVCHE